MSPKDSLEIIKDNVIASLMNTSFISWVGKVNSKGIWDYKYHWGELKGEKAGNQHYELCADFANFNYGLTGSAINLSPILLHYAAGQLETFKDYNPVNLIKKLFVKGPPEDPNQFDLQAFGDEWDDSMNIEIGINYWRMLEIRNPNIRGNVKK